MDSNTVPTPASETSAATAVPSTPSALAAMKARAIKAVIKAGMLSAGLAVLFGVGTISHRLGLVSKVAGYGRGVLHTIFYPVESAWKSASHKIWELDHAQDEVAQLRHDNAELRIQAETLQFGCQARNAEHTTRHYSAKLSQETGSKVGRTLASFTYRIPEQLSPSQLYSLGVSYFKSNDHEKAAAIFSYLVSIEDSDAYKTSRDFLTAGIAWYHLDNLDIADRFFDEVLKAPETATSVPYQAKARVWKSLISERLGKHLKSQYWLRELLDHHPRSTEAGWVNGGRRVASTHVKPTEHESETAHEEKHEAAHAH